MVDQWSSTPPSPQQFPYKGGDAITQMLDVIQRQKRELDEMRNNLLATAGISVEPDQVRFTGAVRIEGTLSLPAGIIDNDALANPIATVTSQSGLNNYAITTTTTVRETVSFTVPAGFTKAHVISIATAMGYNNSGGYDALYVQSVVRGVQGGELFTGASVGQSVGVSNPFFENLTGLTGGDVITVSVATRTSFNTWTATTANQANIYASITYTR